MVSVSAPSNGKTTEVVLIELPKPDLRDTTIRLVGTSPLISHRWAEKAKQQMRDKQMKRAKVAKEAKDPGQDYRDSLHEYPGGGYGFPAVAFKNAAVSACTQISGVTKVMARGAFHVIADDKESGLVKITGKPRMREDMVRIGMGTADIRYRGEFTEWSCTLSVRYNGGVISAEMLANLFQHAGFAVGIGEWRPEKDGSYGMFELA